MKNICVYCGSSYGKQTVYADAAKTLGEILVQNNIGLVYGGGHVGLMGIIAQTVFKNGGHVVGVIPKTLSDRELAYTELDDLRIVKNMHERKALMAELSDGFIAMPGGYGTLEEFFEAITWSQLAIHNKPCGLLNVQGFFNPLITFLDHTVEQGFVDQGNRDMILIDNAPEQLVNKMQNYSGMNVDKIEMALQKTKERDLQ